MRSFTRISGRDRFLLGLVLLAFAIVALRMVTFQIFPPDKDRMSRILRSQYTKTVHLAPMRGQISDRHGRALAVSGKAKSIFINPKEFAPSLKDATDLSELLGVSRDKLMRSAERQSAFIWVKRGISEELAKSSLELGIAGVHETSEPSRHYPQGETGAHILGYVGVDNRGLAGFELQFDRELRGTTGLLRIQRDALGRDISDHYDVARESADHGNTFRLTIDLAIQEIAETALASGVQTAKAKGGFVIVADPTNGAILAVASYPTFDPNRRHQAASEFLRNQALHDSFEPGSVMKPLVVAAALENHLITMKDYFDCNFGKGDAGGIRFSDSHPQKKRYLNVTETLVHSSNVCIYEIAKKIGAPKFHAELSELGFGKKLTHIGFPGQAHGGLPDIKTWIPIRFANIAFGQGLTVNALDILSMYGAFANGGRVMKPQLIKSVFSPSGNRIFEMEPVKLAQAFSPSTTKLISKALESVVSEGANKASIVGHRVAGKTGTIQKVDPILRAYSHDKHRAFFAGYAPANNSRLVAVVMIDEPGIEPHYASLWAAPVFSEVVGRSLDYLAVPKQVVEAAASKPKSGI
jgi:cell division protein FtsI (penicillin-binding protein 3)